MLSWLPPEVPVAGKLVVREKQARRVRRAGLCAAARCAGPGLCAVPNRQLLRGAATLPLTVRCGALDDFRADDHANTKHGTVPDPAVDGGGGCSGVDRFRYTSRACPDLS